MKILKKERIISVLVFFAPLLAISQTGPGGVGTTDGSSNLSLWLNAGTITGLSDGDDMVTWPDQSGNGYDAVVGVAAPSYSAATGGNGQPAVTFVQGSTENMYITSNIEIMPTNEVSAFVAGNYDHASDSWGSLISTSDDDAWNDGWGFGESNNTGNMLFYVDDYQNNVCNRSITDDANEVWTLIFNTTDNTGYGYKSEDGCTFSFNGPMNYNGGANDDFLIGVGANNSGPNYFLTGDIEEIIVFDVAVNDAQRIIISNYLSAKYDISLSNNDCYNEDDNGDYDFDVAGIGRTDASNIHNDAQGTGIIRILNPTGLGNDEFLIWGHDNGEELAIETTDVPAGVDARFERVWRVSEADASGSAIDVGSIDIRWDLTGKGSVTASDLRLLVDTDNDGTFADETPISGATLVSGNVYEFAAVSAIVNNYRFTLATADDSQTPLWVETPCDLSIGTENTIEGNFNKATNVYAIDLDGDGDIDVIGTAHDDDDITWWENDGSESFTEHTIKGNYDGANGVFAIDMDGDGDIDVLGTADRADDITWWENDGSENFTEHTIDGDFDAAWTVFAIDIDSDGDIDVLGTAERADDITWWENDGSENFTEHTIKGNYDKAKGAYAVDVDGDGDIDILGAAENADDITWWENDGSENFTEHTIEGNFNGAIAVYAIDIDGDGDMDVLGAAKNADDITWWENDGSENFTEHTIDGDYDGAEAVFAIDFDCDNDIDILGAAKRADDITWWENDGSESFTKHTIDGNYNGSKSVFAIDVDGDGDLDVLGAADTDDDITWWETDGCPCATSCQIVTLNRHIGFRVRN